MGGPDQPAATATASISISWPGYPSTVTPSSVLGPGERLRLMLGGMRRRRVSLGWSFRGGSGFNILSLMLIGLKLGGVISWPWSMVLLPLWFTLGVVFIIGLGMATAVIGERVSQYVQDRRSGEPAALLVPARREPELDRRQPACRAL
jgi:hypothetical protein